MSHTNDRAAHHLILLLFVGGSATASTRAQVQGTQLPPAPLCTNAASDTGQDAHARVGFDGGTTWTTVYQTNDGVLSVGGDLDVVWTKSQDDGVTWSTPQLLSTLFASDSGASAIDFEPDLAHVGSTRLTTWASTRGSTNGMCGIYVSTSDSSSSAWSAPAPLSAATASDAIDDRAPSALGGASQFIVAWERGNTPSERDIFWARSTDGGATFSSTLPLTSAMSSDTADDRHPFVGGTGALVYRVVWDSQDLALGASADTDIYFSFSNGAGFSSAIVVNSTAATDGTFSDTNPSIGFHGGDNSWICVWRTTNDFGGTTGGDGEIAWAKASGVFGSFGTAAILNSDFATDAADDDEPNVSIDSNVIVVSWRRRSLVTGESDVYFVRSDDAGTTWTAPAPLNTNAATDAGNDVNPRTATDLKGHWVGTWTTDDTLGGTIGTDDDVVHTGFLATENSANSLPYCYGYAESGSASPCPCSNDAVIGSRLGCANSSGVGANIEPTATLIVSAGSRFLRVNGIPAGAAALVFQGTGVQNFGLGTPFGDGRLCVGGTILRLGVAFAGSNGVAVLSFSPLAAGVVAGDVRFYQGWYRDSAVFCTSATFNLSSAAACLWRP